MSNISGPRRSLALTKTISDFGIIKSATMRLSKLMTAAIRERSVLFKTEAGVRRMRLMKSWMVAGGGGGVLGFSSEFLGFSEVSDFSDAPEVSDSSDLAALKEALRLPKKVFEKAKRCLKKSWIFDKIWVNML